MGIRQQRGMPTPGETYFTGGLLICITFGFTLAAIQESWCARDWAWFTTFVAGEAALVVLYCLNVHWWLVWMNLSGDQPDPSR